MKKEVVDKISTLIIAAFALVAALAWNSAIQEIFKQVLGTAEGIIARIIYAVFVTILAVIVTICITKISKKVK